MNDLGTGREVFGLIHGDLHFDNVLFTGPDVFAIDFDDCGLGYWAYDIAIAMYHWRLSGEWSSYWDAFAAGYQQVLPLPRGTDTLDRLIVARHIATALWAASRAPMNPRIATSLHARYDKAVAAIQSLRTVH